MSAESKLTRDKDGFLKCKACPRRFLTEIGFENHSSNQHQTETKNAPNYCQECKKYFCQSSSLKNHLNIVHKKLTPYQCQECKKYFLNTTLTLFTQKVNIISMPRVQEIKC